jgi:hypothetical protein
MGRAVLGERVGMVVDRTVGRPDVGRVCTPGGNEPESQARSDEDFLGSAVFPENLLPENLLPEIPCHAAHGRHRLVRE